MTIERQKKVHIKTYGCQMNVYDSERMVDSLGEAGFALTEDVDNADLVILNTCHIREKATEKIYSELGRYKKQKAKNPNLRVAVAGCVAQAEGDEIIKRQPLVDFVIGPQAYHRLAKIVSRDEPHVDTDFPTQTKFDALPQRPAVGRRVSAFLTVQEGCDKFCSFCVVPYTRGAEASRPVQSICQEARQLMRGGVREIVLLGQNVNAYRGEGPDGSDWSLAQLINRLAEINNLERIRFTTSHPLDMTDDLIDAFVECPKLMPYLHLPIQSGSDRMLKAMNRRHRARDYLAIIEKIRRRRPDILFSGDFIVGFPGETDSDFEDTMSIVRQVGYGQAYSFRYSPRPGTPAAEHDPVDPVVVAERLDRLQQLLRLQQQDALRSMVDHVVTVLFEKSGRKTGQLSGKSEYLQPVHCDGDKRWIGELAKVRITKAEANSLTGVLI